MLADYERERLRAAGVDVVGVSQFKTTLADSVEFQESSGLGFPSGYDPDSLVAQAYGVQGVPTYVMLNADGLVVGRSSGARGMDALQELIDLAR